METYIRPIRPNREPDYITGAWSFWFKERLLGTMDNVLNINTVNWTFQSLRTGEWIALYVRETEIKDAYNKWLMKELEKSLLENKR